MYKPNHKLPVIDKQIFLVSFFNIVIYYMLNFFLKNVYNSFNLFFIQFEIFLVFGWLLWFLYVVYLNFFEKTLSKLSYTIVLDILILVFLFSLLQALFFFFNNNFFFTFNVKIFNTCLVLNFFTCIFKIIILLFSLIIFFAYRVYSIPFNSSQVENLLIISCSSIISIFLVSFNNLFLIFIAFESLFLCALCLVSSANSKLSTESCNKFFMQNAVVSAIMIFGFSIFFFFFKTFDITALKFSLLSIASRSEIYLFIIHPENILILINILWLLGFFFKIGVFPVFFYIPDVYEGCDLLNLSVIVFIIKPACFIIFLKVIIELFFLNNLKIFSLIFFCFGFLSLLLGNLMALRSSNIKRFLGYSSIAQYGFALIFISVNSISCYALVIFQIFIYNFFLIFIFFMLFSCSRYFFKPIIFFSDLKNIMLSSYSILFLATIALLSISGIPPSILFFIKFYLLLNLFEFGFIFLIILILFLNIISIFYYLWFLKEMWVTNSFSTVQILPGLNTLQVNKLFLSLWILLVFMLIFFFYFFDTILNNFAYSIMFSLMPSTVSCIREFALFKAAYGFSDRIFLAYTAFNVESFETYKNIVFYNLF